MVLVSFLDGETSVRFAVQWCLDLTNFSGPRRNNLLLFCIINRKLLTRGAGDSLASKNFVVVTTLPANLTAWLALAVPL